MRPTSKRARNWPRARSRARSCTACALCRPTPARWPRPWPSSRAGVVAHQAAALAGLEPEAVLSAADELSRAHILEPDDPLEFTHPLLRSAVYESLTRRRKAG